MKLGFRQGMASVAIFAVLLVVLIAVDDRVQGRFTELLYGDSTISSWGSRFTDLVGALLLAAKYQSIDNAPMVVFAAVGAVLFLFMLRT
jgi:hypothetical protein